MEEYHFYFVKDSFFRDFPDPNLMRNKEIVKGKRHDRPCFFAIADKRYQGLFWFIPISSRVEKYRSIYKRKIDLYGKCNTICFAEVLGNERAFLIQNTFPITKEYVGDTYIDRNTLNAVTMQPSATRIIIKNAREVLKLYDRGIHQIIFPNVDEIKHRLIEREIVQNPQPDFSKEHTPWNDYLIKITREREKVKNSAKDQEKER